MTIAQSKFKIELPNNFIEMKFFTILFVIFVILGIFLDSIIADEQNSSNCGCPDIPNTVCLFKCPDTNSLPPVEN